MTRLVLTLPWDVLCRDNAKYTVSRGKIVLSSEYRTAKAAAHLRAKAQVRASQRLTGRLAMVATFREPDRRRTRDVTNYAKMLCDALTGAAWEDDGQLDDARYIRGPVDRANPRVEVEVRAV